ncbi:MAG TPA: SufD family Fe-S cluster assembly protein, partial [Ignisphaera sp.]|nr:SufD family Fe-S cluster assembly protein [Ignisphaera sp.]
MSKMSLLETLEKKALQALTKPSPYGLDVDIKQFIEFEPMKPLSLFEEKDRLSKVGIDVTARTRAGYFYQVDNKVELFKSLVSGVEIIPLEQAIEERWDEIKQYLWRLIPVDLDKYTAITFLRGTGGHYIRIKKNTRVELPIQACFLMSGGAQLIHNIVVAEEGSEATIITGCTIAPEVIGLHVGVTEVFVEKGAKLIDIMVHSWNRVAHVRPRTAVLLDDDAIYASYYINMSTTKSLQSFPRIEIRGKNA